MTATQFTFIFIAALAFTTFAKLWLARRHLAYIAAHRAAVPEAFRENIQLADHQKAADYTSAKTRLAMLGMLFDAALLLAFTLGGGIQFIADLCRGWFSAPLAQGMATIVAVLLLSSLLEAPFSLYRTFVIEARFGFNKTTLLLYLTDALKSLLLGAILGLPLLFGVLWLMERLSGNEVEAVLAHELGHFKRHHVMKRIVATFAMSLGFLWLLGLLMQTGWFYQGLGVSHSASSGQGPSTALALLLFFMILP